MNYRLINKNSFGGVILLLLIILLSHTRILDFMINTSLGRLFLIGIILIVSCIHKILGVISVLFIIIIFNNSDFSYLEGMTNPVSITSNSNYQFASKPERVDFNDKSKKNKKPKNNKPIEGSDIIGKERQIQKGRNSNSIPVNDNMKIIDVLQPHERSTFSENFTTY